MNKPLFSFLAIAFFISTLFGTAIARERSYGGKCLYLNEQEEEQDFKSCQVNIQQKTLEINFESEKYRDHNQTIMGKSVREIASGNTLRNYFPTLVVQLVGYYSVRLTLLAKYLHQTKIISSI